MGSFKLKYIRIGILKICFWALWLKKSQEESGGIRNPVGGEDGMWTCEEQHDAAAGRMLPRLHTWRTSIGKNNVARKLIGCNSTRGVG